MTHSSSPLPHAFFGVRCTSYTSWGRLVWWIGFTVTGWGWVVSCLKVFSTQGCGLMTGSLLLVFGWQVLGYYQVLLKDCGP